MVLRYIQGDACGGEYRCDVEPNNKGNLVEYWEYELLKEKNKELLAACEEIAQKSVDGSCVQKIAIVAIEKQS